MSREERKRKTKKQDARERKASECQRGEKKDISMLVGEPGRRPWRTVFASKCKRVRGRVGGKKERKKLSRGKKKRKECKNEEGRGEKGREEEKVAKDSARLPAVFF